MNSTIKSLVGQIFIVALLLGVMGCEYDPAGSGAGPFGSPGDSPQLQPFAGDWQFDLDKTLETRVAGGASDAEIESLRKLYAENPQHGKMHPDLSITGNEAVGRDVVESEYRFFALHTHGELVCGKAWHHEDRFDPGDMSKCYVRLMIADEFLHLDVKMKEGLPSLNDPDLQSPTEHGDPENCDAENPPGNDWSGWVTYVFSRKQ